MERDNDLILDLESVRVNGQRYAIETEAYRVESSRDNSVVGAIVRASEWRRRAQTIRVHSAQYAVDVPHRRHLGVFDGRLNGVTDPISRLRRTLK